MRTPESDTTRMRGTVARMEGTQAVIDGNTFYAYKIKGHGDTLADDASIQILLTTPTTVDVGVGVQALSSGDSELKIYEGATSVTGGTLFVPRNRNRASTLTSNAGVITDPATATGTTVIYESLVIGGYRDRHNRNLRIAGDWWYWWPCCGCGCIDRLRDLQAQYLIPFRTHKSIWPSKHCPAIYRLG